MSVDKKVDTIGDMLLRENLVTQTQLDAAVKTQIESGLPLGRIMVDMGLISEKQRVDMLCRHTGAERLDMGSLEVEPSVLNMVPKALAEKFHVVPIRIDRDGLFLAMESPTDLVAQDEIAKHVGMSVRVGVITTDDLQKGLALYQGSVPEFDPLTGDAPLYIRKPLWYRMLSLLFMPLMMLVPFGLVALLYVNVSSFNAWFASSFSNDPFHVFLFMILGYGLWAVVFYEVDGFLFSRSKEAMFKKSLKGNAMAME